MEFIHQSVELRDFFGQPPSHIDAGLWQSGFPRPFIDVCKTGIDVVVLASAETQPDPESKAWIKQHCPKLKVVLCPFPDTENLDAIGPISAIATKAADVVNKYLDDDLTVLVTCSVGANRSGLISALTLRKRYDLSGTEAMERVRKFRNPDLLIPNKALQNRTFAAYLSSLPRPSDAG